MVPHQLKLSLLASTYFVLPKQETGVVNKFSQADVSQDYNLQIKYVLIMNKHEPINNDIMG